ncbi:ABC transporter substrate-binding protein [Prosthecomicrobium sp. N25]|uniref:ABC transporter substrate-binding protein n=1 Tax=Prosthecomicrobium sp. N25 TaxID=3129254 RepID=UPI003077917D
MLRLTGGLAALMVALAASGGSAEAQTACPVKIGGVLPLTGSMGPITKKIAESAQLAIEHINAGGGVKGCPVQFILRDDQGQPTVGVDAAKYLVEVERVPAFTGTISSGVTGPIISAVTAPSKVVQVSCCSTASPFTDGRSQGYFFRTLPTSRTQAYATASEMARRGLKKTAVIYVNTDFGSDMLRFVREVLPKLGGEIAIEVPYNDNQPSYRAEVTKALSAKPESLLFIGFPKDGVTVVREWLSLGGSQKIALNNSNRVKDFVDGVGAKFLNEAFGMDNAQVEGPSVDAFNKAFEEKYKYDSKGPGVHTQYDAVMAIGLAMNIAPELTGPAIKDAMRKIHTPGGETVGTGPEEFKKAIELIKAGKPIKYHGATGPLEFDANGDVTGPALVWKIENGEIKTDRIISIGEMQELFKKYGG